MESIMERHNTIMTELHDLLERIEPINFGSDSSVASLKALNSMLTSQVGLTRPQRLKFFEGLINQFPNRAFLSPYAKDGQMTFEFLSTRQLIQPVVSAVIDWMKVKGAWEVRPDAAEAIHTVVTGEKRFPDD